MSVHIAVILKELGKIKGMLLIVNRENVFASDPINMGMER